MATTTDPAPDRPEALLTAWRVALRLNVSRTSVYKLVAEGKLKSYRLGSRMVRFRPAEVDALLEQSRTSPEGGGR